MKRKVFFIILACCLGYGAIAQNMNYCITLNVKKNEMISFRIKNGSTSSSNIYRVVSGKTFGSFTISANTTSGYTFLADDTIMTIYGNVYEFYCNGNGDKITGIDVNKMSSSFTYLDCHGCNLSDFSTNHRYLRTINLNDCNLNRLSITESHYLQYLWIDSNNLTAKDITIGYTDETGTVMQLQEISVVDNPFTTQDYNDLLCALPSREHTSAGKFTAVKTPQDTTALNAVTLASATMANMKNWIFHYWKNPNGSMFITTTGTDVCMPEVDTTQYITLKVLKGRNISMRIAGMFNDVVRVKSGATDTIFYVGRWNSATNYTAPTFLADDSIMTIYGNVQRFFCDSNESSVTGFEYHGTCLNQLYLRKNNIDTLVLDAPNLYQINAENGTLKYVDVTKCPYLTYLYAYNNELTHLDVSEKLYGLYVYNNKLSYLDVANCTNIRYVYIYNNPFTTEAYNDLMCSLHKNRSDGNFQPLYNDQDTNSPKWVRANANIALQKNWTIQYGNGSSDAVIPTTGKKVCSTVNYKRYIKLSVMQDSIVDFQMKTLNSNPPALVRISWGNNIDSIVTIGNSENSYRIVAIDTNIILYGDIDIFWSTSNVAAYRNTLTGVDVSHNTELCTLDLGSANNLTYLNIDGCTNLRRLYLDNCTALGGEINCSGFNQLQYIYTNRIAYKKDLKVNLTGCSNLQQAYFYTDSNLTELNLTGCNMLRTLIVTANRKLTSLDLSNLKNLETCSTYYNTALSSLNLSGCVKLCSLGFYRNTMLSSVYLTGCSNIEVITGNNCPSLTTLNLQSCKKLRYINVDDCNLSSLDVSNSKWLTTLRAYRNGKLTSLNAQGCTGLRYLYADSSLLTETSVNVRGCVDLTEISLAKSRLTSLDVSSCKKLNQIWIYNNPFTIEGFNEFMCSLPDHAGESTNYRVHIVDQDKDTVLDYFQNAYLQSNTKIATDKGWKFGNKTSNSSFANNIPQGFSTDYICTDANMNNCIKLSVKEGSTIKIDLFADSANTIVKMVSGDWSAKLKVNPTWTGFLSCQAMADTLVIYGDVAMLNCNNNRDNILAIDASNQSVLRKLYCFYNRLSTLNLQGCVALEELTCANNALETLDVTDCNLLTNLECNNNALVSLTANNNPVLTKLVCNSNKLTSLNINNNLSLNYLDCGSNRLDVLDLSANTVLTTLKCAKNNLSTLDVSNNPVLSYIECNSNKLNNLDLSSIDSLFTLKCSENELTTLDISNNVALNYLECNSNQLNNLNISNNTALRTLSCYKNAFTIQSYDELMCSMPTIDSGETATIFPLENANDMNVLTFMATNANNAIVKNWNVLYANKEQIPATSGNFDCEGVNKDNYIVLDVVANAIVNFSLSANANTPVKVLNGSTEELSIVNGNTSLSYTAEDNTITIYGDVLQLNCENNVISNIKAENNVLEVLKCGNNQMTSLDIANAPALKELNCSKNQLSTLNLSQNNALEQLYCAENQLLTLNVANCANLTHLDFSGNRIKNIDIEQNPALTMLAIYNNPFTTGITDTLMCVLPQRSVNDNAVFMPIFDNNDANINEILATNANNAKVKNWNVVNANMDTVATNGEYDCIDGGVSVSESEIFEIALYPNPAKSVLNIENATEDVQIFDITGRLILSEQNQGQQVLQINVSELSNGMYFVKIGNYMTKFIKE